MADRRKGGRSRSRRRDRRSRSRSPRSREEPRRRPSPPRRRPASRSRSRSPGRRERDRAQRRRSPSHSRSMSRSRSRGRRGGGSRRDRSRSREQRQRSRSGGSPPPRDHSDRPYRQPSPPRWQAPPPLPPGAGPGGGRFAPPPPASEESPPMGSIHHGTVASVRPFGAFVELPGFRKQGLVHFSQVSEEVRLSREDDDEIKVKTLEYYLPRGEKVWVKVTDVRFEPGGARIACSMKVVSQEDGTDLDPDNLAGPGARGGAGGRGGGGAPASEEPPELHSVHRGVVQSVRPFGVFVRIDGFRKYGLVHFSQISDHLHLERDAGDEERISTIGEVLSVDEPVWVKVVEVQFDERGPKIGCSIKLVDQRDGTDLDPNNLKYRPREGGGGPARDQPIGASAGAVAQPGQVDWGHLKADVVQYGAGGRTYELVTEPEERPGPGPSSRGAPAPPAFATGANAGPLPPRGRGRGATMPAWMTAGGEAAAPGAPLGGGGGAAPGRPSGQVTSIEQALAILEQHGKGRSKRSKKEKKEKKKGKKEKREKKEKRHRDRKERRRGRGSSSSGSSSESD